MRGCIAAANKRNNPAWKYFRSITLAMAKMTAKDRIGKAGEAAKAAQRNQYLQRLVEDEQLRSSLLTAYGAARNAYGRMSNGKPASRARSVNKFPL